MKSDILAARKQIAQQQAAGYGGADLDDEDHRILRQLNRIQLENAFLRRPADDLRIEKRARMRQALGQKGRRISCNFAGFRRCNDGRH